MYNTYHLFTPATLAVMYSDIATQLEDALDDDAGGLTAELNAIAKELAKHGFYMQFIPARYKMCRKIES